MLTEFRLSREEREAAYNKARERIFGKEEKAGDVTPGTMQLPRLYLIPANKFADTEEGNEMSRSSSVSTKDRASQNKRPKPAKQRRDDSDSFDSRSQYTPFFPQQQIQTWAPAPQYAPIGPQPFIAPVQNTYQNPMPPQFTPPPQQFNSAMMNNGNLQTYNSMPQVNEPYR
jgi:hypothetical protein